MMWPQFVSPFVAVLCNTNLGVQYEVCSLCSNINNQHAVSILLCVPGKKTKQCGHPKPAMTFPLTRRLDDTYPMTNLYLTD
ncbi:hypothetical protein C4D60_Mb11t23960 [Musa balbisiana]|uniref:Uncharacterized protein n=1 Tax=Musa balbisiana TaxID=52838 RepID=A0A4V4H5R6_MUSBA|nr:hypothetical protein C4D60_Mb11t23960 [Musa balbisiana]